MRRLRELSGLGSGTVSSGYFVQTALLLGVCTVLMLSAGAYWISLQATNTLDAKERDNRTALAVGLGLAVTESVAMGDFGAIEARLIQALSNQNMQEAVVTDRQGSVLAFVKASQDGPVAFFGTASLERLPTGDIRSEEETVDGLVYQRWQRIEAGTPIGWLRITTTDERTRLAIGTLGQKILLLVVVMTVAMLTAFGFILRRAYRVIAANEFQLNQSNVALQDAANRDPLTQIANRSALMRTLETSIAHHSQFHSGFAVCFMDLDGFKPINDNYGHDFGDEVLRVIAGRIKANARQGDLPARIGGDEFVLLVNGIDNPSDLGPVLSRLIRTLCAPIEIQGKAVSVGLSVGASLYPRDGSNAATLLVQADQAMYLAKKAGGNRSVIWEGAIGHTDLDSDGA